MTAIQEISARIGRVTGIGISGNLRKNYPKPLLYSVLFVVSAANIFNLGADIGAMGAALQLVVPGKRRRFHCVLRNRIAGRHSARPLFDLCEIPQMAYDFSLCLCRCRLFCPCLLGGRTPRDAAAAH